MRLSREEERALMTEKSSRVFQVQSKATLAQPKAAKLLFRIP